MTKELFSFSKLTTFHTCPHSYYLTYIKKSERKDNIYSFLGKKIHWLLEELQQEKITNEKAVDLFKDSLLDAEMIGYNFPTENTKNTFTDCMIRYFENYTRFEKVDYFIEEYFKVDIAGVTVRGYIDIYTITDEKYIDIYDYKSSSKFSKKDLETKKLQLVIYALALQEKYPDLIIRNLYFDMLKYTKNKRGTLIERNKHDEQDKRAFVKVKFDEDNIKQAKEFVSSTYEEINELNPLIEFDWKPNVNKFFCVNICSNKSKCKKGRLL